MLVSAELLKGTGQIVVQSEKRTASIERLERAFQALLMRGYNEFGAVFRREEPLAGSSSVDLDSDSDSNSNSGSGSGSVRNSHSAADSSAGHEGAEGDGGPDVVAVLVARCRSLEHAVDEAASEMREQKFHSNAERVLGYVRIILPTIGVADAIDKAVTLSAAHGEGEWRLWDALYRKVFIATTTLCGTSLLAACLLCLLFSFQLVKRVLELDRKAEALGVGDLALRPIGGSDEIAFLDCAFVEAAQRLAASQAENELLVNVVAENILVPAAAARDLVLAMPVSGSSPESRTKNERVVESAFNKIKSISGQLVDSSAMGRNKPLNLKYFSLDAQIEELFSSQAPLAAARNIELVCRCRSVYLMSDVERFGRILANLVSNALKFSPEFSQIAVNVEATEDSVRISVLDEGPGLAESDARRVFDKYFQSDEDGRSTNAKGFGLGLSICTELVQELGGNIGYLRRQPRGSEFWFSLPRTPGRNFTASQAGQPFQQNVGDASCNLWRSKIASKFLLLLLLPLVSQAVTLWWTTGQLSTAHELLSQMRRHEQLTVVLSRSWMNMFGAGYLTALNLASPSEARENAARKHISQLQALGPFLEPGPTDSKSDALVLKDLLADTTYQIATLKNTLDSASSKSSREFPGTNPGHTQAYERARNFTHSQDAIGTFAYMLNAAFASAERMEKMLTGQFGQIAALVARQADERNAAARMAMVLVVCNLSAALGLAYIFSRIFSSRVADLVAAARGLAQRKSVEHPKVISDELDKLKDLLAVSSERLIQADLRRDALISAIAHDIRSPLQALNILLNSTADLEIKSLPPQFGEDFETVRSRLLAAANQVDDLLILNKLKQTEAAPPSQAVNLNEMLVEVVSRLVDLGQRKDIFIDLAEDGLSHSVEFGADPVLFEQLLEKMIRLAIENAPPHSTIEIKVNGSGRLLTMVDSGEALRSNVLWPPQLSRIGAAAENIGRALTLAACWELARRNGLVFGLEAGGQNVIYLESST